MNYDSWKLASDVDAQQERLEELCSKVEAAADAKLAAAIAQVNRNGDGQWTAEPVLADSRDDGVITLELNLRLKELAVTEPTGDLQELAQAIIKLGESLSQIAQSAQTSQGLKLAPSEGRTSLPRRNLG